MQWREFITDLYRVVPRQPGIASKPEFYPGASAEEIVDAEVRLNARLPLSLRSLLLESNGIMDLMAIDGGEWFDNMWLLWTVSEMVHQNLAYRAETRKRTYGRAFHKVVLFAGAGSDGILFGFPVMEDGACAPRVVVWHPIEDDLEGLASALEDFLRGWLTSTISI
jgi:hypothetical protein